MKTIILRPEKKIAPALDYPKPVGTAEFAQAMQTMQLLVDQGSPDQAYSIRWELLGRVLTPGQASTLSWFSFVPWVETDERD